MLRNLILLAVGLAYGLSGSAPTANDIVRVEGGQISGSVVDGVRSYKGIPFAAAPVGDLRWKAPQPPPAWEGVRECNEFGPDCPQARRLSLSKCVDRGQSGRKTSGYGLDSRRRADARIRRDPRL
jgi:hypothetical protein